jgi:tetratricopeptide (TPR) repeat protein
VVVTAAALGAATLLLDTAARREREARQGETDARLRAEENYRLAREAVDRYFTRVGDDARLKGHGLEPLRKDLLEQAGDFYERLARAEGPGGGPAVEAERGHASLRLAEITASTGDRPRALRLAREGRDVFERLVREHPGDGEYRDALAACLDRLGAYCRESGEMGAAKEALDRSVALREQGARDRPDAPEQRYRLAVTLGGLGWWYTDNGRRDEAAATLERALALSESLTRDRPDSVEYRGQLAATLQHLGRLRAGAGQTDRAAAAWEKALPLFEALARERPEEPECQSQLALTLYNLAALYSNTRRPDRVKAVCEQALPVCDRLVAEHPDVPAYRDRRASVRSLLAVALALLGEYRQAAAEAESLASGPVTDGLVWYNAACGFAV